MARAAVCIPGDIERRLVGQADRLQALIDPFVDRVFYLRDRLAEEFIRFFFPWEWLRLLLLDRKRHR